jgi:RNA polymerase sigma factor (sigma-70 family)
MKKIWFFIRRLLEKAGIFPQNPVHYIGGSDTLPPPLPRDQEAELLARLDDPEARRILIEHNLRLVVYIARRFENTGINVEDLISIGTIGLIKAVGSYRLDKNIRLATYASRCIENEILMYLKELPKVYDPRDVESRIYQMWMDGDCFSGDPDPKKPPFSIVMPPPNVTGQLHMGHALDSTLQDILTRYKRMQGYSTLWVPGTTTRASPPRSRWRRKLRNEGKTRYDLGREKFLERVWDWKNKYGTASWSSRRPWASSCDWEPRPLHHGRRLLQGRARGILRDVRKGPHLQGQPHHQLVPALHHRPPTPRWSTWKSPVHLWYIRYPCRTAAAILSSPPPGRDYDGRHRRGREPGGRALQDLGRQDLHSAADEPRDPHRGDDYADTGASAPAP